MSEEALRRDLCAHYGDRRLPEAARARLVALVTSPARRSAPPRRRRLLLIAVAATAAAILVAAFLFRPGRPPLVESVAREIALHHRDDLPAEFEAASFEALRVQMVRLDFAIVDPAKLEAEGVRPSGARYCAVRGHRAARIRLVDARGRRLTLFEVRAVDELADLPDVDLEIDGARVRLWREGDVLLGLAGPSD